LFFPGERRISRPDIIENNWGKLPL